MKALTFSIPHEKDKKVRFNFLDLLKKKTMVGLSALKYKFEISFNVCDFFFIGEKSSAFLK